MDDYTRGPRCNIENCPSTRYTVDESGFTVCSEGHHSGAPLITQIEDAPTAASQVTRAKSSQDEVEITSRVLTGRKAIVHFLLCYQLVLVTMVEWLTRERGFHQELEDVVRALWGLRVGMLKNAGFAEDSEDGRTVYSSLPSQQEDQKEQRRQVSADRKMDGTEMPRQRHTTAFLYLACLVLRLPVVVDDICGWLREESFPYLNAARIIGSKRIGRLPVNLKRHFNVQVSIAAIAKCFNFYATAHAGLLDRPSGCGTNPQANNGGGATVPILGF